MIRTRFAPSPTGHLHLGSLRTALFNYLFAKRNEGALILRVEDTDVKRNIAEAEDHLRATLHWAGVHFDEGPHIGGTFGPYRQSERLSIYRKHVGKLLKEEKAYHCFASKEEVLHLQSESRNTGRKVMYEKMLSTKQREEYLRQGTPHVIRLKVPASGSTSYNDTIYGRMEFSNGDIEDQVLMRSDGSPTYHLASVIDDHSMDVSHVIRGEEWLQPTAKHVLLYQAFEWELPVFCHLPLLVSKGGGKLSKRNKDAFVDDFRRAGVLPSALINYVAFLGWSPGRSEKRIFSMDELVGSFSLEEVNRSNPTVDSAQIHWFNKEHLKMNYKSESIVDDLRRLVKDQFDVTESTVSREYLEKVLDVLIERVSFLSDVIRLGGCFWVEPRVPRETLSSVSFEYRRLLKEVSVKLDLCPSSEFKSHGVVHLLKGTAKDMEVPPKVILKLVRMAVTGQEVGGELGPTLELLGKETVLKRLRTE
eukprot:m.8879 g.8879  ORF g.8879 m.8879 type:complete len:476 (+) comp20942_c0_seq1:2-1429(+)